MNEQFTAHAPCKHQKNGVSLSAGKNQIVETEHKD